MISVIDIGTNTFHLLIADILPDHGIDVLYRESRFVRIAKDGVAPVSEAAILRAIECLKDYKAIIDDYLPDEIKVLATEGFRSATNAQAIIDRVKAETQLDIEIISGEEEAKLIFLGTIHAIPPLEDAYLIMDIGGGSVEFIIGRGEDMLWSASYRIGVQYLFHQFPVADPIEDGQVAKIKDHLVSFMTELKVQIDLHQPRYLVGASGSFETIAELYFKDKMDALYLDIPFHSFDTIYDDIIQSTLAQRLDNPFIPNDRAELIVMGLVLIRVIVDWTQPAKILVSRYALREGILFYK